MKIVWLLIILCFHLSVSAQESMVSCRGRETYLGIDNPLDIFVEGHNCSSILVTTDNGELQKNGCQYVYRPSREGDVIFTIYKKQEGKTVKLRTHVLHVHTIPTPDVHVGGFPTGWEVSKAVFSAQVGVSANWEFQSGPYYIVDSFSVAILYDSTMRFSSRTIGNAFDQNTREAFSKMEVGSIVLFYNIWVSAADKKLVRVKPLEYIIR